MGHDYHEGQPNYNKYQLFHDGCYECKTRVESPVRAIEHIKDMQLAWHRAVSFEKDWLTSDELPISEAEAPVLRMIWALIVRFERDGIPLGIYPPLVASILRDDYHSVDCPYCKTQIWGDKTNIDSGLRKHIEYCPQAPDEDEDNTNTENPQ